MKEPWLVCLLALLLKHLCLGVVANTESTDTNTQPVVTTLLNELEVDTALSNYTEIPFTSSKDSSKQTLLQTSLLPSTSSTQTPVLRQSTTKDFSSVITKLVQQPISTVITKPLPTRPKSISLTTEPPKGRKKKKGFILLIVLIILCGLFFIFACVIPYLKKRIKLSKLRHHLVPVYSFEPGEGEDWETELLTEHRNKDGQQTGDSTARATIVREVPKLRLASEHSEQV
ncbi:uncharacterized protein LOC117107845 isoform X2 [Anneissia japonica]|uniref:uncharacterized protein LOC117107845 isoform X2 n=1 Tax=Anneissia japonica TaxID=1529436 RepID=UPI00142566FE|nr:uncharacterized protein LOC117107845 isoform X2 [Anneissia japonica]